MSPQLRKHPFRILEDAVVRESNNCNVSRGNVFRSLRVIALLTRFKMAASVQFNRQSQLRTVEINDIFSDPLLPTELMAIELAMFQVIPKDDLGFRLEVMKILPAVAMGGVIKNPWHARSSKPPTVSLKVTGETPRCQKKTLKSRLRAWTAFAAPLHSAACAVL